MLGVTILGIYALKFQGPLGDQERFAQFGDFVGGTLNPILGFATVALLIWSINIQMRELRLTREELKATKEEAALSREAMQQQVEHFVREARLNESERQIKDLRDQFEHSLQITPASIKDKLRDRSLSLKSFRIE